MVAVDVSVIALAGVEIEKEGEMSPDVRLENSMLSGSRGCSKFERGSVRQFERQGRALQALFISSHRWDDSE